MAAPIKNHWKLAARKTKYLTDPWENLGFDTLQEKSATRHVYNPVTKEWWKDNIMIKIEEKVHTGINIFMYLYNYCVSLSHLRKVL